MEGDISGIILIAAFAAVATSCAMLMRRLWRAGVAGRIRHEAPDIG